MTSDDLLPLGSANITNHTAEALDEDPEFEERMHNLQWVAYGVVAPILIATGIVGNLLNLLVLTRPTLRGVMYTYLTWLAISDLMSLVFTIPTLLRFAGCARRDFYSSWYHAHVELAVVNAFMACSVFIVVAVTVDRFFSVSRPTKYKTVHTPDRARLWIGCSYTGAFLLYIPVCFFKEVHKADGGDGYVVRENFVVTKNMVWTAYLWFKEILVRLGPSLVLTCLNILIIVAFQRVVRRRKALLNASRCTYAAAAAHGRPSTAGAGDSSGGSGGGGTFQEERRLVMLLISIVVMFVVTMTPAAFLTLFLSYEKERNFNFQVFRAFANNMEFVNYAMNFYLYCLCSAEIRSTFLSMFNFLKKTTSSLGRHSASDDARPPLHGGGGSTPPCSRANGEEHATQVTTSVFVDSKI